MDIGRVVAVYFSPTGGTKKYVKEIAKRIKSNYEEIDLTNAANREKKYQFGKGDLVIFGSPVYFGRVPRVQGGIFDRIRGDNTTAIYTVTYGNRDYEDALLELSNICNNNGFVGISAAALVAPHAFSSKIAFERPDSTDLYALDIFVKRVKEIIDKQGFKTKTLTIKGKYPYRKYLSSPFFPSIQKKCRNCGTCVGKCPVEAINTNNPRLVEKGKCIACLACVKSCPYKMRKVKKLMFYISRFILERKIADNMRIAEFFYIK
ncbi:MAG: EFR1 family ferrodoxin [Synergistaceae bacterium]|nr:EFR1 family ferrodoxin [Synergistaceae bacterium]